VNGTEAMAWLESPEGVRWSRRHHTRLRGNLMTVKSEYYQEADTQPSSLRHTVLWCWWWELSSARGKEITGHDQ